MKHFSTLLLLPLIICHLSACHGKQQEATKEMPMDTLPMMVTQIQKCSRLYTTEYHIHKIVTHADVVRLKGNLLNQDFNIALPLGERKIAIPMNATLKAYIDFSDFSEQNIERHGNQIVILLPDPKVTLTSSKINQKEIREYVGLVRSHFTDQEMTSYEQQGREAILKNISNTNILTDAQASAARVLVPMLTQMGYQEEDVIIAFRKDLNLQKLINSNLEQK